MLDTRTQARLTKNYTDAAVGYANASAAAWRACTQQAIEFWTAPLKQAEPPRRDLSWFNPNGNSPLWLTPPEPEPVHPWAALLAAWGMTPAKAPVNPWNSFYPAWQRPATNFAAPSAPQLQAMTWAFAPFAMFWGTALRGPTFAWPMAYSLMAQGVPDSVAWPTAEANAAVIDATATLNEQAQAVFSTYQSAGGFATAHILPWKDTIKAMAVLVPVMSVLPIASMQPSPLF